MRECEKGGSTQPSETKQSSPCEDLARKVSTAKGKGSQLLQVEGILSI